MQRSLLVALGLLHSAASFQPTSRAVTRTAPLNAGFATTTRKKKVKKGSKGAKSKDAAGLTTQDPKLQGVLSARLLITKVFLARCARFLEGSEDGGISWVPLDSRVDQLFQRCQARRYWVARPRACNAYRIVFAETADPAAARALTTSET